MKYSSSQCPRIRSPKICKVLDSSGRIPAWFTRRLLALRNNVAGRKKRRKKVFPFIAQKYDIATTAILIANTLKHVFISLIIIAAREENNSPLPQWLHVRNFDWLNVFNSTRNCGEDFNCENLPREIGLSDELLLSRFILSFSHD